MHFLSFNNIINGAFGIASTLQISSIIQQQTFQSSVMSCIFSYWLFPSSYFSLLHYLTNNWVLVTSIFFLGKSFHWLLFTQYRPNTIGKLFRTNCFPLQAMHIHHTSSSTFSCFLLNISLGDTTGTLFLLKQQPPIFLIKYTNTFGTLLTVPYKNHSQGFIYGR